MIGPAPALLREHYVAAVQRIFAATTGAMWLPDPATMYAAPNGVALAVAGVGTGMLMDQGANFALGGELVVSWDFSPPVTSWSVYLASISDGAVRFTNAGNNSGAYKTQAEFVPGVYEITVDVESITSGAITATLGITVPSPSNCRQITTPGIHKFIQANTGDSYIRVYSSGVSTTAVVSSVSVKRIAGYHAIQATEANRPPHLVTPLTGRHIFVPSGTQALATTLPNWGSCSVIRPRPDGTVSITTETINGSFTVTEKDRVFCGCFVVQGTLTAYQLWVITQLGGWYRPGLGAELVSGYLEDTAIGSDGAFITVVGPRTTSNSPVGAGRYYNISTVGGDGISPYRRGAISILRANATRYFPGKLSTNTYDDVAPKGALVIPADAVGMSIYFKHSLSSTPTGMSIKEII